MTNQDLFFVLLMLLTYGFAASVIVHSPLMPAAKPPAYGILALVMLAITAKRLGLI